MSLSDKAKAALEACFCTRGKNKGMLLRQCPPSNTLAAAAWQGAMLSVNPYKVSVMQTILFTAEQREVAGEVTNYMDNLSPKLRTAVQRDRRTLEAAGVW